MDRCDVLVIGARVGGSVLAARLADRGHDVLLVDRDRLPSPTLSTHFFRGGGLVGVLRDLRVLDDALALGAPPLRRQWFTVDGGEPMEQPPQDPGEVGFALSVRREPLDALLLRRAREAGARVEDRARLVGLVRDADGRVAGARVQGAQGGEREVRARFVVGADGRHSRVAALAGASSQREDDVPRALYYRYYEGLEGPQGAPDAAEFSLLGDELAYVFPSDAGLSCVALSTDLAGFAALRQAPAETLAARLARHRGLADRLAFAKPVGPVLGAGPERNYVRAPAGPGWALVGDAGLHLDPFTGLGMDYASVHATFLAEALDEALRAPAKEPEALARYHERRDAHALPGYETTVHLGQDLRRMAG